MLSWSPTLRAERHGAENGHLFRGTRYCARYNSNSSAVDAPEYLDVASLSTELFSASFKLR
jgi:hypothetical protein